MKMSIFLYLAQFRVVISSEFLERRSSDKSTQNSSLRNERQSIVRKREKRRKTEKRRSTELRNEMIQRIAKDQLPKFA